MGDRIVSVPPVRVAAIPVVAGVSVSHWPISTKTNKDVFAVIVRIKVPKCEAMSPVVVNYETTPRPDYSVAYPIVAVEVYVLIPTGMSNYIGTFAIYYGRRPPSSETVSVTLCNRLSGARGNRPGPNKNSPVYRFDMLTSFIRRTREQSTSPEACAIT